MRPRSPCTNIFGHVMELAGTNALVTGGAVRLGRALVELLADEGCGVAVHHHTSESEARTLVASLERRGLPAVALRADLADAAAATDLVPAARDALGSVEILINNAAVFPPGEFLDTGVESWDRQMAIDLRAPFLLSQSFVAGLTGTGQILNVTDRRVRRPATDHFAYRLAKSAVAEMTRMLARELAPRVRVNAVALGALLAPPGEDAEAFRERVRSTVPLGAPGGPRALVHAARFLLTAPFQTGVVLPVDGGEYL